MEALFTRLFNTLNPLHGHDGFTHEISIILCRSVASFFKLKRGIHSKFLTPRFTIGFGPCDLAWIALFVEVAMTFGPTETEHFGVITNEHYAMAGIAW
jgi:hypothetical protein